MRHVAVFILSLCLPILTSAEEVNPCSAVSSYRSLLPRISEQHPEVIRANEALRQIALGEDVAKQFPNPELDSKAVFGNIPSGHTHGTEVALLHTFELGGKRSSRIEIARAEGAPARVEVEKSRSEALTESVLTLHRLPNSSGLQIISESNLRSTNLPPNLCSRSSISIFQ